jgi:hypothetical protein
MLDRYSCTRAIYDNLDSKVFFRATWQGPRFVEARLKREAEFKLLPASDLARRRSDEEQRIGGAVEFLLGVQANDYHFDDFDRSNSMWRVVLAIGDEELAPTSIERIGRTTTELRSYYSYLESFWVAYRLRFPARDFSAGQVFSLRLASAVGHSDLNFTAE